MRKWIVPTAALAAIWAVLRGVGLWRMLAYVPVYDYSGPGRPPTTWWTFTEDVAVAVLASAVYLRFWVIRPKRQGRP